MCKRMGTEYLQARVSNPRHTVTGSGDEAWGPCGNVGDTTGHATASQDVDQTIRPAGGQALEHDV
jgi:hypothetical protein